MSKERAPKTAYELAMERLREADAEAGVERRPLTAEQKARIAEVRQEATAKLAEIDIMLRKELGSVAGDPEKTAEIESRRRIDRERVESGRDAKIARVKAGKD